MNLQKQKNKLPAMEHVVIFMCI